ncbi:MAG: hypothetical protein Q9214_002178, partial [Letrouitia sp. 1 TL-2023]
MHEEDLAFLDLGLSGDDAAAVFSAADAVTHDGADMSYLKTFASLCAANLQSIKDLVRMIARHSVRKSVPFHYVSTVPDGNIVATALTNGENIVDERNDLIIHRPSLITRRTWEAPLSGQSKEETVGARLEFIENLRRFSSLLRAVPAAPAIADKRVSISGVFDVVPLGDVVKDMVDSLRKSLTDVREERVMEIVGFLHHISGGELPLNDVWGSSYQNRAWERYSGNKRGRMGAESGQARNASYHGDIVCKPAEGQLVLPSLA